MSEPILPPDPESSGSLSGKIVTVCIVVATLAGAVVGYLQSETSTRAATADGDAHEFSVRAFSELARATDEAHVQYELFLLEQQQLRRAWSVRNERLLGPSRNDRELRLEQLRWEALAAATRRAAVKAAGDDGPRPIARDGVSSPDGDPLFPGGYLLRAEKESYRLTALRDAASAESAALSGRITSYVILVALFGVAVYLFSFSLTPQGREDRRLFAGVAGGLTLIGATWAVLISFSPVERAPATAAETFAEGRIEAMLGRHDDARDLYTKAIERWPDFARAHFERGSVEIFADSPQRATAATFVNMTEPSALRRAIDDFRESLAEGANDVLLLNNIGYLLVEQGIRDGSTASLDEGIEYLRRAQESVPDYPLFAYNIALAHFSAGRYDEARAAYSDALEMTRRGTPGAQRQYVASALTGLEFAVAQSGEALADPADQMKAYIIGGLHADGGTPQRGSPGSIDDVEVVVTPAWLQVAVPTGFLRSDRQAISVYWYRHNPGYGWSALHQVSGPLDPVELATTGFQDFVRRLLLPSSVPAVCIPSGRYRVELFVNGGLAARAETSVRFSALQPRRGYDLGYVACLPQHWKRSPKATRGLVDGYTSPDGKRGLYVLRVDSGKSGLQGDRAQAVAIRTLDAVLDRLPPLFPSKPRLRDSYPAAFGVGPFEALQATGARVYRFDGGRVLAAYGLDARGAVLIALAFGPKAFFDSGEPYMVVDSVVSLF